MFLRSSVSTLILAAVVAAQTPADPLVLPAPPHVLQAYDLNAGELQRLDLPIDGTATFSFRLRLAGQTRAVRLSLHDVRSPAYRLLVDDGVTVREHTPGPVDTYRGAVDNQAASSVAATLRGRQLSARIILADGSVYGIEPVHRIDSRFLPETHLVFAADSIQLPPGIRCGLDTEAHEHHPPGGGGGPAVLRIADIALDCDFTYYQSNGSSVPNTESDVRSVMNAVDAIYIRDVEIQYNITTIIVRTAQVYSGNNLSNLLSQMQSRWNSQHGGVVRDLAHLFVDRGVRSGVIGIAFLGVVCNLGSAYGVSATRFSGSLAARAALTAHECGHNWNANHCNSLSDCRIMCSGLGGCTGIITSFGAPSISAIVAFKNSRSCLSSGQRPVVTSVSPSTFSSWEAPEVTLQGSFLDTVTQIRVGSVVTNSGIIRDSAQQIRFRPAGPMQLGGNFLFADNSAGASSPQIVNVTGNHPSVIVPPQVAVRGIPYNVDCHTDGGWVAAFFLSTSNAPSVAPGLINLGIGNNFSELIQLAVLAGDNTGTARLPNVNFPISLPQFLTVYWQAVTINIASPSFPLEVSNVGVTGIL